MPLRKINPALLAAALVTLGMAQSLRAADSITQFAAVKTSDGLHITAEASSESLWANTQLMIDTDNDPKTGYHIAGYASGFDVMVEGATVYTFKGAAPGEWNWAKSGTAARTASGKSLTCDIAYSALGTHGSDVAMVLRALSKDYQSVAAAAPAGNALSVNLEDGNTAETAADAKKAAFSATATQDGTDLVIKITAATPADLDTVLVFFDTDANAATGFNPPADPRFGFDYLLQGTSLSHFTGATRDAWTWATLSPVQHKVDGATAELRFNASLLKSNKIKFAAWQMSPDWQSRIAFSATGADGRAGTADVAIDPSKLKAALAPADVPLAPVHANAALPARQRFAEAKSYACYYGGDSVGPLSHVDAAILHVPAMTSDNVKMLSKLGVVTIGYISVGEDEHLRVANGTGFDGKASWYFDKDGDGKPDMNGTWGSVYANCADPAWRADRVAEAKRLCGEYGFDGIFLDTVDTVDVYPASREGMIKLIEELREAIPDKVIVANRGFTVLAEPRVARSIDGVMFEDFSTTYDFQNKTYLTLTPSDMDATRQIAVTSIKQANDIHPLKVLALDYCQPDQADRIQMAFDRAVTYGMLPAVAPISLDMVYDTSKVVAKPDPALLEVQATPEKLQYTLPEARNGFPAGTIVQPTSCFFGYTVATLVDGIADHTGMNWMKSAWASAEVPGTSQSLLLQFPQPVSGGALQITFAYDNKAWFTSRDFTIDMSADGKTFTTLTHPTANADQQFRCTLPDVSIRALRITQSPGGGSADRPNLMWLQQLSRLP